jgi:hypothetical protein
VECGPKSISLLGFDPSVCHQWLQAPLTLFAVSQVGKGERFHERRSRMVNVMGIGTLSSGLLQDSSGLVQVVPPGIGHNGYCCSGLRCRAHEFSLAVESANQD